MGVFKKLLSAVSVTLTATIAFTFPVQAVAANLSKFSSAEENDTENTIVGELVSERDEYTKYFRMSDGSTMERSMSTRCIIKTIMTNGWNIIIHCLN